MTSQEGSNKRARLEEKALINHPTLYFDDGNIIIRCGSTLFRVHRSLLSKHSPVFREMFIQKADTKQEFLRGCLHVVAADDREEMEALLNAIYDGLRLDFPQVTFENFPLLANLLLMTTKYQLARSRAEILARIQDEWPIALDKHDAKTDAFCAAHAQPPYFIVADGRIVANPAYNARAAHADDIVVHPARVIALLRQSACATPALLAPLFYALSCGTWQFGGAAVGHHLAPLAHADVERFVVGLERLRSAHAAWVTQCPAMVLPSSEPHAAVCMLGIRRYWGNMGTVLLKRMCTQGPRTPLEDWRDFATVARREGCFLNFHICAQCYAVLFKKIDAVRQLMWSQLPVWFEL